MVKKKSKKAKTAPTPTPTPTQKARAGAGAGASHRGSYQIIVTSALSEAEFRLLTQACERANQSRSKFIREAVAKALSAQGRK